MEHRFWSFVGASLFVTLVAFGAATAQTINLHWDACDSWNADKPWTGPGLYRQVVTGWGFDAPMRGYSIRIRATSSNVYDQPTDPPGDAWRFDPAGCNAGNASTTSSIQPCPSLGTGATVEVTYEGSESSSAVYITLSAHHDLVDPNPSQSYVLGEILYDHTGSASGPQNPAVACGNAEEPVCFIFRGEAVWYDAANVAHSINYDYFMGVSWGNGEGHCFGDLPVQPAAWTAVKRLYD